MTEKQVIFVEQEKNDSQLMWMNQLAVFPRSVCQEKNKNIKIFLHKFV